MSSAAFEMRDEIGGVDPRSGLTDLNEAFEI